MQIDAYLNGWNRIATGLDVEIEHGVPVRISNTRTNRNVNKQSISDRVLALTGLTVSVDNWVSVSADEQESSVCIDKREFIEVLRRLALSSAALFVDRFHKPIDRYAVDWDKAEYDCDFNHAVEHCRISHGLLNKDHYFDFYIKTMHEESLRLIEEGISPIVEAE